MTIQDVIKTYDEELRKVNDKWNYHYRKVANGDHITRNLEEMKKCEKVMAKMNNVMEDLIAAMN